MLRTTIPSSTSFKPNNKSSLFPSHKSIINKNKTNQLYNFKNNSQFLSTKQNTEQNDTKKKPKWERIDSLVCSLGLSSRRKAKFFIRRNNIEYKGKRILRSSSKVNPYETTLNGHKMPYIDPMTLILNKPVGVSEDPFDENTIFQYLPEIFLFRQPGFVNVLPLPKEIAGISVLSQIHDFRTKANSSRVPIKRVYDIQVEGKFNGSEENRIREIRNAKGPHKAKLFRVPDLTINENDSSRARLVLHDQRPDNIFGLLATLEQDPISVTRVQLGDLDISSIEKDFEPGNWKPLSKKEEERMFLERQQLSRRKKVRMQREIEMNVEEELKNGESEEKEVESEWDEMLSQTMIKPPKEFKEFDKMKKSFTYNIDTSKIEQENAELEVNNDREDPYFPFRAVREF